MSRTHPNVEPPDELQAWRQRALQVTLIATLSVGAIPLFLTLREALHDPRQQPAALFFLVAYLSLVPLLALRHLGHRLRAWGLLLAGYATGGMALARGGLAGSGRVYLLALPVVATVLVGGRAGMAAMLLSLLTYGGFTLAAGQGWLQPWLVHPESLLPLSVWLNEGATFAMLLAVVTSPVSLLVPPGRHVARHTGLAGGGHVAGEPVGTGAGAGAGEGRAGQDRIGCSSPTTADGAGGGAAHPGLGVARWAAAGPHRPGLPAV
nr:hypothetical protein [Anaerolineae bacterium]